MLKEEIFEKIMTDPIFSVIINDRWEQLKISKSYYYSLVKELRRLKVLEENALAFKAILAYRYDANCIKLINDKLAFLSEHKIGVAMKLQQEPNCLSCKLMTECVYGLKLLRGELRIRNSDENLTDPHARWLQSMSSILDRIKNNETRAEIII
ncbi:hypothetical protein [Metallosphaera hakonensis]|nr:hypothetical protein [Metallosphaera hakonensis]